MREARPGLAGLFQPSITFVAGLSGIGLLRLVVRLTLRRLRDRGRNLRRVLLVGHGKTSKTT
ncbi:MAG: hypothetical protein ACE5GB_06305, partial [Acidimicrobiales bacterium]